MSRIISCAAALLIVLLLAAPAMARVGFVNPQVIVSESEIGKLAQDDLARLGRLKDTRIRESAEQINALKAQIDQGLLSEKERDMREDQLKRLLREHEKLVTDSNLELREQERRLIEFIMKRADKILRSLAESRGFTMILTDPEAIGYINLSVDLTDEVLKELDKGD
ncbi:OmpH family outer membrane protein [Desulfovibrio oxyclinae]|uniref:OmpH family outer membrane protein n=1 Tax=Desulfovibrio oxyclinae TaxID=63560 RepID=UPI0014613531|nr:OmpH family outer membrane protein [Desulfovibrio oxyclinae]